MTEKSIQNLNDENSEDIRVLTQNLLKKLNVVLFFNLLIFPSLSMSAHCVFDINLSINNKLIDSNHLIETRRSIIR